jgi:hypothetical protein
MGEIIKKGKYYVHTELYPDSAVKALRRTPVSLPLAAEDAAVHWLSVGRLLCKPFGQLQPLIKIV